MSTRDPLLTDEELEIEVQADMEASFAEVRNPIRPQSFKSSRTFKSKAEERRFNSTRKDW